MPVARVSRRRQTNPRARIEESKKSENESARRARRHDHPLRGNRKAVPIAIKPGDAFPKCRHPQRQGVAETFTFEGLRCRHPGASRRRCARLPNFHMNDVVPGSLTLGGGAHHIHDDKAVDVAAPSGALQHVQSAQRSGLLHCATPPHTGKSALPSSTAVCRALLAPKCALLMCAKS